MAENSPLEWTGLVAAVLTLGSIVVATTLSPSFAWREHALSNLGVSSTEPGTTATVLLFNGGLVAGGFLGLGFALLLYREAHRRDRRLVAVLLGLTLVSMALIGVFPQDRPLHVPVALAFFIGVSVTLWTDAIACLRTDDPRRAVPGLLTGTGNAVAWLGWVLLAASPSEGLAIPELLGAVCFATWVCVRTVTRQ